MNDVSEDQGVKFLRLKNGDDVIAQVVEFAENDEPVVFALINPLKVIYIPSTRGSAYLQVAFMPWVFSKICDEQEFMIHSEDVITMGNVTEKMLEYYWSNLDHFVGKDDPVEDVEEESVEEETTLENIIEAIQAAKRTYH